MFGTVVTAFVEFVEKLPAESTALIMYVPDNKGNTVCVVVPELALPMFEPPAHTAPVIKLLCLTLIKPPCNTSKSVDLSHCK